MFSVLVTLLATSAISHGIQWNGNNWAASCEFIGNDLTDSLTNREDCGVCCASNPGCTHYTWTNYNGGTCWMKNETVSKDNAVPKYDEGATCGIIVRTTGGVITAAVGGAIDDSVGGIVTSNVSGAITSLINWNGKNWAASCDFVGNDLTNALTKAKDCGRRCSSTLGCTHYTWTNYNGGTCWMKKNKVSKNNAVLKHDQAAVCGVVVTGGNGTNNVSLVITSAINWNGKNWAASCDFVGNDLTSTLTKSNDCGGRCSSTLGCTHYTWTNYRGGTCWMKKNKVSKNNAVPKQDQGAICGVAVADGFSTSVVGENGTGNVSGVITSLINWNGRSWAASCEFVGNDLRSALTRSKDCGGRCTSTFGCTHYTWTNYNGGTCWMKKNKVSKNNAVPKHDQGAVCGVIDVSTSGNSIGTAGGVITSGINWNGKNWAVSCDFVGNDLTTAFTRAKDCGGRCTSTFGCTHYTWTNFNGGTCWMKKNKVSKDNAVPKHDQGAVCGVIVGTGGTIDGAVGGTSASGIIWNENECIDSCDLTNVLSTAEDCWGLCCSTPGCSHYTWTNFNGGTCWMKRNSLSKINAITKYEQDLLMLIDRFRRPMPYYTISNHL